MLTGGSYGCKAGAKCRNCESSMANGSIGSRTACFSNALGDKIRVSLPAKDAVVDVRAKVMSWGEAVVGQQARRAQERLNS